MPAVITKKRRAVSRTAESLCSSRSRTQPVSGTGQLPAATYQNSSKLAYSDFTLVRRRGVAKLDDALVNEGSAQLQCRRFARPRQSHLRGCLNFDFG
jgi:hypothetical protein